MVNGKEERGRITPKAPGLKLGRISRHLRLRSLFKSGLGVWSASEPEGPVYQSPLIDEKRGLMDENKVRRGGFEPPSPCGHRISNPAPCQAGLPPLGPQDGEKILKCFLARPALLAGKAGGRALGRWPYAREGGPQGRSGFRSCPERRRPRCRRSSGSSP